MPNWGFVEYMAWNCGQFSGADVLLVDAKGNVVPGHGAALRHLFLRRRSSGLVLHAVDDRADDRGDDCTGHAAADELSGQGAYVQAGARKRRG
jgi:hypothetical protein